MDQPENMPVPDAEDETVPIEAGDALAESSPEVPETRPEPAPDPSELEPAVSDEPVELDAPAEEPAQLSLDEMVDQLTESPEEPPAEPKTPVEGETATEEGEGEGAAAVEAGSAETAEPTETGEASPLLLRARLAARLPFWILGIVWVVLLGVVGYFLWAPAAAGPFIGHPLYAVLTWGGVGLTVAGPLLGLVVWLVLRRDGEPELREGLARAVFMRAAVATVVGNALWWGVLVALDLHRAGVFG